MSSANKFFCKFCDRPLKNKFSLRRHFSNVHPEVEESEYIPQNTSVTIGSLKCGICEYRFREYLDFTHHLVKSHGLSIKREHLEFKSDSEFKEWKKSVEENGNVSFIKPRGARLYVDGKVEYFQCHRSGNYRKKISNRQRETKIQGSSKINAYCPARIKAVYSSDGIIYVDYCETHVGHEIELAHLKLSSDDRKNVAAKIAAKVPFDTILSDVCTSVDGKVKRKHLLTKQDLRNITRDFSLDTYPYEAHSNGIVNIESWVKKERASNRENCIIIYKPKDIILEEYPHLNSEDFMLGVMNETQVQMIKKFGNKYICIDYIHGSCGYSYDMTTLLVLDDSLQVWFPCAFYFSSRNDRIVIEKFLTALKEKVGVISPLVIMTDIEDIFYYCWEKVMGECHKRFFCAWNLQQAWKIKINQLRNYIKRKETYKKIFSLQKIFDETAFELYLSIVVKELYDDQETREFGIYFNDNFVSNCKSWAYCYLKNVSINATMNLERLHGIFKHLYDKGKMSKSLHITVQSVIQYVNQKLIHQFVTLEKVKVINTLRYLKDRHKKSLTLSTEDVVESSANTWNVFSAFQMFTVSQENTSCDCSLKCEYCNVCIHKFNCTCIDACVRRNMCKHIHLVCRKLLSLERMQSEKGLSTEVTVQGNIYCDEISNITTVDDGNEECVILEIVGMDEINYSLNLEASKQEINNYFFSILNRVSSMKEVGIMTEVLKNLEARLYSLKEEKTDSLTRTRTSS